MMGCLQIYLFCLILSWSCWLSFDFTLSDRRLNDNGTGEVIGLDETVRCFVSVAVSPFISFCLLHSVFFCSACRFVSLCVIPALLPEPIILRQLPAFISVARRTTKTCWTTWPAWSISRSTPSSWCTATHSSGMTSTSISSRWMRNGKRWRNCCFRMPDIVKRRPCWTVGSKWCHCKSYVVLSKRFIVWRGNCFKKNLTSELNCNRWEE